jgi:hypothetical protein
LIHSTFHARKASCEEKTDKRKVGVFLKAPLFLSAVSFSFDFLIKNKFLMMKTPGGGHNQKMQMNLRAGRRRGKE